MEIELRTTASCDLDLDLFFSSARSNTSRSRSQDLPGALTRHFLGAAFLLSFAQMFITPLELTIAVG